MKLILLSLSLVLLTACGKEGVSGGTFVSAEKLQFTTPTYLELPKYIVGMNPSDNFDGKVIYFNTDRITCEYAGDGNRFTVDPACNRHQTTAQYFIGQYFDDTYNNRLKYNLHIVIFVANYNKIKQ